MLLLVLACLWWWWTREEYDSGEFCVAVDVFGGANVDVGGVGISGGGGGVGGLEKRRVWSIAKCLIN